MDKGPMLGSCLHTPSSRQYPHGKIKPHGEYDPDYVKKMQREGRVKSSKPSETVGYLEKDPR